MLIDSYLMQARRGDSQHANISTLKVWFPCTETNGETITDTQSGLVWSPNDEYDEQTGLTITGNIAGNTLTVSGWTAARDFDGYFAGDSITISGSGGTALAGTYTIASVTSSNVAVVNETIPTETPLTSATLMRNTSRGQMQFESAIGAVYPAMSDNGVTGLGGGGVINMPTPFRSGTFPTIQSGKSMLVIYAARVMTEATPSLYDANKARMAFGDNNDLWGGGAVGIGLAGGNYHMSIQDDSGGTLHVDQAGVNFDETHNGKDVVNYIKFSVGTVPEYKCLDLSDYSTLYEDDNDTSTLAPTYDPDDVTLGASFNYMRCSGLAFYGIAVFAFDTMPSDIDEAIKWMGWAWKNGYRIPYPGAVSWK